ncbi:hypothetical protein HAZT_HAZT009689 [Hyalella azteca]|uniref:EF-hand domain-containing protein n=1 Tax=Hyalella azteca TaxID=294128 RepID=A0A6A0GTQ3_HYAAZ|nr:hypothetical protein HAZT_HAZT009689 [Hyalella azteca]
MRWGVSDVKTVKDEMGILRCEDRSRDQVGWISRKTENGPPPPTDNKLFSDEELVTMIDPILEQDDHNKDGYIDYTEFMAAQQKAAVNTPQTFCDEEEEKLRDVSVRLVPRRPPAPVALAPAVPLPPAW